MTISAKDDIQVNQGKFLLGAVDIIHSSRNLLVLEVDCHSKYPGMIVNSSSNREKVMIFPGDRSLHLHPTAGQESEVILPARCTGWVVVSEGARYTVRIVAYRPVLRRREVWRYE